MGLICKRLNSKVPEVGYRNSITWNKIKLLFYFKVISFACDRLLHLSECCTEQFRTASKGTAFYSTVVFFSISSVFWNLPLRTDFTSGNRKNRLSSKQGGWLPPKLRDSSEELHHPRQNEQGLCHTKEKKKLPFSRHCGFTLEIRSSKLLKLKFFVDQTLYTETFSTSFWSSTYTSERCWLSVMIPFFTPYADVIFHYHTNNPRTHLQ